MISRYAETAEELLVRGARRAAIDDEPRSVVEREVDPPIVRLLQLGLLPKSEVDSSLDWFVDRPTETPRLFSDDFVETLRCGLDAGTVSVPRATALLGLTVAGLVDLFHAYHTDTPLEDQ